MQLVSPCREFGGHRSPRRGILVALVAGLAAACSGGGGGGGGTPPTTTVGPASPNPIGLALTPPPAATAETTVTLEGVAAQAGSTVEVLGGAGPASAIADVDASYSVEVPLTLASRNALYLRETTSAGEVLPALAVDVVQDSRPPRVEVDFPAAGAVLAGATTRVAGRVGDSLSGFLGLEVTVGGEPAEVDRGFGPDGTFWIDGVELPPGPSTIVVAAADALGNERTVSVQVERDDPTGFTLSAFAGDGQSAARSEYLAAPIEVLLERPDGVPLGGKQVRFTIDAGGGRLSEGTDGTGPALPAEQFLDVTTDAAGIARARWQVGERAGRGVARVRATSVGVNGTAWFHASVVAGAGVQVHAVEGDNQVAVGDGIAPRPLVARVTDGLNPVAGATVRFEAADGLVRNPDTGQQGAAVSVVSDATGLADVQFFPSATAGVQRIDATVVGAASAGRAPFAVRAVAGGASATSLSGAVLDVALRPLVGVECVLELDGQSVVATTDGAGSFEFTSLPTGGIARLEVRGETAVSLVGALGQEVFGGPLSPYPAVEREFLVTGGAANRLAGPLLLPRTNDPLGVLYNGTLEVPLVVNGMPEFRITIPAGTLTLPASAQLGDGTLLGVETTPTPANPLAVPAIVLAEQVGIDDLPAPLPGGAPALAAWFLSPPGASVAGSMFMRAPNLFGLEPRSVVSVLSFDQRGGRFERVGTATVGADGRLITLDEGAELDRTGWLAISAGGAVGSEVVFDESAAPATVFDESWVVRFGGRTTPATAGGGFTVAGVPLRDALGLPVTGPQPDGVADRNLSLTAVRSEPGSIQFATTPALTIDIGQSQSIAPGTIANLPPDVPLDLDLSITSPPLLAGGQVPLEVTGFFASGGSFSLTPSSAGTTYRSSDPDVAVVGPEGLGVGLGAGTVMLSALNGGLTVGIELDVSDPLQAFTQVVGVVVDCDDQPVADAVVTVVGGGSTAMTSADGSFAIADVPVVPGAPIELTVANAAGTEFGAATLNPAAQGDTTDAGLLLLVPGEQVLVFGDPVGGAPQGQAVADALTDFGFNATFAADLPADLTPFTVIWSAETLGGLTAAEEAALIAFVESGRGLHLSGERPCCEAANDSVERILDALLVAPIQVGELGNLPGPYAVSDQVLGGLAGAPYFLGELPLCAAGGLDPALADENVLARALNGIPAAAAFGSDDLLGGAGLVTVVMDTDWEFQAGCENQNAVAEQAIVNLVTFLASCTAP